MGGISRAPVTLCDVAATILDSVGAADAIAAHYARLQSGNVSTVETSSLHLDALRDLKQVNSHLIEGAAYPVLSSKGALLPTRLRSVAKGA